MPNWVGGGLVVRLVNKVEVSSSGRTLAQICLFSRYLYSFKLSVFVYVCICVFVFFSRCAANKCEMVLWKMQNKKQYSGINAYFFCSFCAISETKRSLRDPLVSKWPDFQSCKFCLWYLGSRQRSPGGKTQEKKCAKRIFYLLGDIQSALYMGHTAWAAKGREGRSQAGPLTDQYHF